MTPSERAELIEQLDDETVALTLEETDDEVAADIIEDIVERDVERAADIIEEMDPDEVADVLGEVESEAMVEAILDRMEDPEEAAEIKHLLSYDEGTAGAMMNTDIIGIPEHLTCGEIIEKLRAEQPTEHTLHHLHLEDENERLVGVISLAQVVLAPPETPARDLAEDDIVTALPETGVDECARLIAKYDLFSLPVVDLNGCLLGVVTVDDVLDEIAPEELANRPLVHTETAEEG
jgi:Mg/Co/Ni transporter MgtE